MSERSALVPVRDEAESSARSGFWSRLRDRASDAFDRARREVDTDLALQAAMAAGIEAAAARYPLDPGEEWAPGKPLKLLFAGYAGTRNTGADVRVEEMIRQVRHLLGDDLADLSILTIDPERSRGYFRAVKQVTLPKFFPRFVVDTVHGQHGVIACEGSMFKSKFANALAVLMVGALGVAAAENKLAIGYGGEAGKMDPSLEAMVRRYLGDAYVIARNPESVDVLANLGVRARAGTDTAWTIDPAPAAVDAYSDYHYAALYFHKSGPEVEAAQARYIASLAAAIKRFRSRHDVFPIAIGMEMLDRRACAQLSDAVGGLPQFVSDEHDMYQLVSLLRHSRLLLSSRYHACVCSMPASVASVGVTMDERIRNLMTDRGTPELALTVDDPDLADRAHAALERLWVEGDAIGAGIRRCVAENLVRQGRMGGWLVDHLRERHPELPIDPRFGGNADALAHLPPLPPLVQQLLERAT